MIDKETGRLPPSGRCKKLSQRIKGYWRAKETNLDPSEAKSIIAIITEAQAVNGELKNILDSADSMLLQENSFNDLSQ